MTTIVYTAQNGLKLLETELGTWMDTTDATTDLTTNLKDLIEIGTLTKSAVNTNAPLMRYSGFSAADYLDRAYDSDFDLLGDPATNGHTLMAWIDVGAVTDIDTIMYRQDSAALGALYALQLNADGTTRATVDDGTNTHNVDSPTDLNNTGWNFIVSTWDGVDTQNIYINGVLDTTDSGGGSVGSLVNATAKFRIGLNTGAAHPCDQGLTMCKVLPYEVSARDILSVYESEKTLFVADATYVSYNDSVEFSFPASQLDRSEATNRTVSTSIGGNRQTIFNRADVTWDITSSEMYGSDVLSFQHLLSAVAHGNSFTYDPYELNESLQCKIDSNKYTAKRIDTTDYFTFSFKVIEI